MKRLIRKEYNIWIIGGFFWAFFMYVSNFGFTLNIRWEFILLYIVGGLLWGLLSGFLFNLSFQGRNYDTDKYKEVMKKRLKTGRKINRNLKEYNMFIHTRDLDTIKDLWDIMIVKIIELESKDIVFVRQENWYDELYIKLNKVAEDKTLTVQEYEKLSNIVNQFLEFDSKQFQKLGIVQFSMLLSRMVDIVGDYVLVTKEDVDEFEVVFLFYYYALKLGIVELNEFQDYLNKETLKDDVKDVIIDLQFVSSKSVNEIIEVMYKYLEEDKMILQKYVLILVARGLSYQAVKLYKENSKTKEEFLDIMYSMYSYFRFVPELHVFDHYDYYPELDGFELGIEKQEGFSINIKEFLGKEGKLND